MGKKKIIKQTEEALLKEVEANLALQQKKKSEAPLKVSKRIPKAKVYINATYNNTIISLVDLNGNVIAWSSAGKLGYSGTKKSTAFVASKIAEVIVEKIKKLNIGEILVLVKGVGSGREAATRSFISHGINVVGIKDITPIPHNGCRPPKVRRV